MVSIIVLVVLLIGFVAVVSIWRKSLVRDQSRKRLQAPLPGKIPGVVVDGEEEGITLMARPEAPVTESIFKRRKYAPWIIAAVVAVLMYWPTGLKLPAHDLGKNPDIISSVGIWVWECVYCITLGVIAGLIAAQVEDYLFENMKAKLDQQLADSLDMMITALRSGVSVEGAMERAASEIKAPLKPELQNIISRIRFGDDRKQVMRRLIVRVPMESYRLFAVTLAVHFEVGGALGPTLAVVARVVRDRMEIAQRVRSLTGQSRASTMTLIILTYGIAFLMYAHDPPGVKKFCVSDLGAGVVAVSMVLEAVGIVWQAAKSKIKV